MEGVVNLKTSLTNQNDDYEDINLTFMSSSVLADKAASLLSSFGFTEQVR